jgi:hypothetical protein
VAFKTFTDEQKAQIAREFARTQSIRQTAFNLGLTRDAVRQYKNFSVATRAVSQSSPPPIDPIVKEKDRLSSSRILGREKELIRQIASERSFREFLEDLMREIAPAIEPPPPYRPQQPQSVATQETMLAVWSDWHAYESVDAARVLGLNHYDAPTMGRRVRRLVDATVSIKDRMERGSGWRFPKLAVACNGDFVSGTIHEAERHSDAPSIIHAVYGTGLVLASALRDLAAHFGQIDVYCTSGNHGRLPDARRMQQKDPCRSWDTLIYLFAMTSLKDIPSIRFHIPESYVVMYSLEGWNFLQTHGHEIKSWNQIPYYGIDRFGRNINALLTANEMPIHYFIVSHFHSLGGVPSAGGETFINGSLIGGTEFSVNALGKCDVPKQWLFCVHPEHGVTSRWPILANGDSKEGYSVSPWTQK